jgi:Cu/Ag efflux pump CusA
MAVVILGGIVTSTFLNMVALPALYLKFANFKARAESESLTLQTAKVSP